MCVSSVVPNNEIITFAEKQIDLKLNKWTREKVELQNACIGQMVQMNMSLTNHAEKVPILLLH